MLTKMDQLNALSFKMQTGNKNLPRERSGEIAEDEMPGMGGEIPKEETYNKYGDTSRKIEIGAIGKHGAFTRMPFS